LSIIAWSKLSSGSSMRFCRATAEYDRSRPVPCKVTSELRFVDFERNDLAHTRSFSQTATHHRGSATKLDDSSIIERKFLRDQIVFV